MEPRPSERGNALVSRPFSGLQILLQWSHVLPNVETSAGLVRAGAYTRFNGATSFRTWKLEPSALASRLESKASMEPRPFERGNRYLAAKVGRAPGSFNGATSFRTWKRRHAPARGQAWPASMEPRPFERGNLALSAVRPGCAQDASMEPRPFERGNQVSRRGTCQRRSAASMEPRPFERGNLRSGVHVHPRAGASMEPRPFERGNLRPAMRRWRRTARFNGATSFRTWKQSDIAG